MKKEYYPYIAIGLTVLIVGWWYMKKQTPVGSNTGTTNVQPTPMTGFNGMTGPQASGVSPIIGVTQFQVYHKYQGA